jgi:hypothetical protein
VDGIQVLAEGISQELHRLLPRQRKTQRHNLALLVATMLDVRSANLMDLAAGLPRDAERLDMRYQWIERVLKNPLIDPDAVMAPFAREVLSGLAAQGQPLVLILDQSKLNDRHQVLMLAVRHGERALPLLWRVEATEGAIGFAVQKVLLDAAVPLLPEGVEVCLMADRFLRHRRPDHLVSGQRLGLSPAAERQSGRPGRRGPDDDQPTGQGPRLRAGKRAADDPQGHHQHWRHP